MLKNPFVMGAAGGAVACGLHYVNRKIIKKEEKVDSIELVKVFVAIAVLVGGGMYVASRKNLLPKKLLGGSTAGAPVPSTHPVTQTGGGGSIAANQVPVVVAQTAPVRSAPNLNSNPGVMRGNQTISSLPNPQNSGLQLSDINDVIHTGTPNF